MTSLRDAVGKPAVLRDSAEQVGEVRGYAVDSSSRRVTALLVAAGRGTRLVDWPAVGTIGPDAVIVESSREPADGDARAVAGDLDPLDKRALSDLGNELGRVTDAVVDDAGAIDRLEVGDAPVEGSRLCAVGSYAVVVRAEPGEG